MIDLTSNINYQKHELPISETAICHFRFLILRNMFEKSINFVFNLLH